MADHPDKLSCGVGEIRKSKSAYWASYNELSGRLRISVTPSCQLACQFCHAEGNQDHGKKKYMNPTTFSNLLKVFDAHQGREVNITGGEPLLHPSIRTILRACDKISSRVTLSTNGLLLKRTLLDTSDFRIDQIKVSLHSADNDINSKTLLGKAWNYENVRENIRHARILGYPVILNFTLTKLNFPQLPAILKECAQLDVDLKIIDLGQSEFRPPHTYDRTTRYFSENYVDPRIVTELIRKHSKYLYTEKWNTGNHIAVYETENGRRILVKDGNSGKLHTNVCKKCKLRSDCSEGIFALRVNTSGEYMPCLLRRDLIVSSENTYDREINSDSIEVLMSHNIERMMK